MRHKTWHQGTLRFTVPLREQTWLQGLRQMQNANEKKTKQTTRSKQTKQGKVDKTNKTNQTKPKRRSGQNKQKNKNKQWEVQTSLFVLSTLPCLCGLLLFLCRLVAGSKNTIIRPQWHSRTKKCLSCFVKGAWSASYRSRNHVDGLLLIVNLS